MIFVDFPKFSKIFIDFYSFSWIVEFQMGGHGGRFCLIVVDCDRFRSVCLIMDDFIEFGRIFVNFVDFRVPNGR